MDAKGIVTGKDYRQAKFMINNISYIAPANSPEALAVIRTAEKVIILYHLQQKGAKIDTTSEERASLIGQHEQNAALFFAIRAEKRKMHTK